MRSETKQDISDKRFRHVGGVIIALAAVFLITGYGCGKGSGVKTLGEEIPGNERVVKLAEILEEPDAFNGRKVVMKGIVSGQCASLCEFFYKEGTDVAVIYPWGFRLSRLNPGTRVDVYAQVISGEENVVFSALGISYE